MHILQRICQIVTNHARFQKNREMSLIFMGGVLIFNNYRKNERNYCGLERLGEHYLYFV